MNQHFRELLGQSELPVIDDPQLKLDQALERFARLVVLDCVKTIQREVSMKYAQGSQEETEDFMAGHYAGSLLSRVVIKQRFGVTENE